ncbi:MAG: hypothetical protein NTV72_01945 [Candidatus Taylorbacteria bacterium]|nr:hypothetical protein [Candidatus Taylorbacteria bacterium]
MSHFNRLPEFEKEFKKLSQKYQSLPEDLKKLEKLIEINPVGVGMNFIVIQHLESVRIVKTRLACKSLRDRSIRIIYAYHNDIATFMYIEMYFKGEKVNENRERITEYVKSLI